MGKQINDSGAGTHLNKTGGARIRCRFRSVSAHDVLTANGEMDTHKDPQDFVRDLNLFVTVQLLEETPTVFSL